MTTPILSAVGPLAFHDPSAVFTVRAFKIEAHHMAAPENVFHNLYRDSVSLHFSYSPPKA
jgi:hypothetical protein